jgi:hypothetical protein
MPPTLSERGQYLRIGAKSEYAKLQLLSESLREGSAQLAKPGLIAHPEVGNASRQCRYVLRNPLRTSDGGENEQPIMVLNEPRLRIMSEQGRSIVFLYKVCQNRDACRPRLVFRARVQYNRFSVT